MRHVNRCAALWPRLVDLALGATDTELTAHVEGCAQCARSLAQLRPIVGALAVSGEVPAAWVERAVRVFPRRARAKLLGSSMQLALARTSVGEPFLLRFEIPGGQFSVMYRPTAKGWEALGEVDVPGAQVSWPQGRLLLTSDLRFQAVAKSLSSFEFLVEVDGATVAIPTPEEADAGE